MSRGRHHTYCTELRTDTTPCSGFTVAAKGQRGKYSRDGDVQRKCGTERCNKKGEEKKKRKRERNGRKKEDERGGGRRQEGSMQIAQDLTGIFLDV